MKFTFSSLITSLLFNTISIIVLYFILKSNAIIKKAGIRVLFISILISILHLLIPFEFPFTKTVTISKVWPHIYRFFNKDFLVFNSKSIDLAKMFFIIWMLGIVYFFIKKSFAYYNVVTVINKLNEADSNLKNMIESIVKKYNRNTAFKMVISEAASAPMILGLWRPVIIVPEIKLSDKEWYYILSHEIAHYFHGDLFIKFILEFFTAIYWWNPFVYYLKGQTSRLLEINTDTNLVKLWEDNEKLEYIECLVKQSQNQYFASLSNWTAAFINNNPLSVTQRVHLILDDINKKGKQSVKTTFFILCISFTIILWPIFFIIEPYSTLPEHEKETFEVTPGNSYYIKNDNGTYDFYLNGKYMITQEEIVDYQIIIYENIKEAPK